MKEGLVLYKNPQNTFLIGDALRLAVMKLKIKAVGSFIEVNHF